MFDTLEINPKKEYESIRIKYIEGKEDITLYGNEGNDIYKKISTIPFSKFKWLLLMFTGYNLYEGTNTEEETISLYEDHRKVISITIDFPLDLMLISYEDEPNKPVKFGNFHSEVIKYSWVLIGADGKPKLLNNSYGKNGE